MSIVLDIICPDHLRVVFDESAFKKVTYDEDNIARDILLMWLTEAKHGLWLSQFPDTAKQALFSKFEYLPYLKFENITFCMPGELRANNFDRVVFDNVDYDPELIQAKEIRILEYTAVTPLDALGYTLEERKELLAALRTGNNVQFDEDELLQSICRESFFEFIKEFWNEIIAERPIWNWHIKYISDELQYVAERVFAGKKKQYDLIINIPPGTTKSTTSSIMFPAWTWTRMPSSRYLGGSYVDELATDLARKNKDVVISNKYQRLFPEVQLRKDQHAKSHFVNTKGGSRYSFGTQGMVTGMHAHFICVDDPLNPEKAVSEVELNKANRVMSETLFTRKVDKDLTPTILIMQRLHQNDCTQHVLDTYESVKHICLPAEDSDLVKPAEVRKFYVNGLLDPARLSLETLKSNFKALGEFGYAGQFNQTPVPRGGAMFKPDRITLGIPTDKWVMKIRYWDKAGTQGAGCFTAGMLLGLDNEGRFWILDIVRGQWGMDEREAIIKSTAAIDGKETLIWVEQEPGSGGKDMALYTVRNLAGYRIQADHVGASSGNKVVRAGPCADQVNGGNFWMVAANWNKPLIDELRYFPASKYKDQVDAMSGAFNHLAEGEVYVGKL